MVHLFELILLDVHTALIRQRRDESQEAFARAVAAQKKHEFVMNQFFARAKAANLNSAASPLSGSPTTNAQATKTTSSPLVDTVDKEAVEFEARAAKQLLLQAQRDARAASIEVNDATSTLEILAKAYSAGYDALRKSLGPAAILVGDDALREFLSRASALLAPIETTPPVYVHMETAEDVPHLNAWAQRTSAAIEALREQLRLAQRSLTTLVNKAAESWSNFASDARAYATLVEHVDGALATVAKRQIAKSIAAHLRAMQGRPLSELFSIHVKLAANSKIIWSPAAHDVAKLMSDVLGPIFDVGADTALIRDCASVAPVVKALQGDVDSAACANLGVVSTISAGQESGITGRPTLSFHLRSDPDLESAWKQLRLQCQSLNADVDEVESSIAVRFGHLCAPDMTIMSYDQVAASIREIQLWDPKTSIQGAVLVNAFSFRDAVLSMLTTQLSRVREDELQGAFEAFAIEEASLAAVLSRDTLKSWLPSGKLVTNASASLMNLPSVKLALRSISRCESGPSTDKQTPSTTPNKSAPLVDSTSVAPSSSAPNSARSTGTAAKKKAAPQPGGIESDDVVSTTAQPAAANKSASLSSPVVANRPTAVTEQRGRNHVTEDRENVPEPPKTKSALETQAVSSATIGASSTAPSARPPPSDSVRAAAPPPAPARAFGPPSGATALESPRPHTTPVNTRKILQSWDRTNPPATTGARATNPSAAETVEVEGDATVTVAAPVAPTGPPARRAIETDPTAAQQPTPPQPPRVATSPTAPAAAVPSTSSSGLPPLPPPFAPSTDPRPSTSQPLSNATTTASSTTTGAAAMRGGGANSSSALNARAAWESPTKSEGPSAAAAARTNNTDDVHSELQRLIQRERESMERLKQLLVKSDQRRAEEARCATAPQPSTTGTLRASSAPNRDVVGSLGAPASEETSQQAASGAVEEDRARRQREMTLESQAAAARKRQEDQERAQKELELRLDQEAKRRAERQMRETEERDRRKREAEAAESRRQEQSRADDMAREKELRDRLEELDRRRRAEQLRFQEEQRALEQRLAMSGSGTQQQTVSPSAAEPSRLDASSSSTSGGGALRRKLSLPGMEHRPPQLQPLSGDARPSAAASGSLVMPSAPTGDNTPRRGRPVNGALTATPEAVPASTTPALTSPTALSVNLSLFELYRAECAEHNIKPNSGLLKSLPKEPGRFVTTLNLDLNYIGIKGVVPLFAVLRRNRGLTSLNLKDNNLENNEVRTLCGILCGEPGACLTHIDLSNNPISLAGGSAVMDLVSRQKGLTTVVLRGTLIQPKVVEKIVEAARANGGA